MLELMLAKKKATGGNYASFGIFTHGQRPDGVGAWDTVAKYSMVDSAWTVGIAMFEYRASQGWTSAPTKGYIAGNGATTASTEKYDYPTDTAAVGKTLPNGYFSVGTGNSLSGWYSGGSTSQRAISRYDYAPDTTANSGTLGNVNDANATGGGNASFGVVYNNAINKITYATDTAGFTTGVTAVTNSANISTKSYGLWVNGGNFGMSSYYQTATKYVFATDVISTQTGIAVNKQTAAGANDSVQGLIAGGWNASGYVISCDTYQFATNTVAPTANMTPRRHHSGLSTNPGWY